MWLHMFIHSLIFKIMMHTHMCTLLVTPNGIKQLRYDIISIYIRYNDAYFSIYGLNVSRGWNQKPLCVFNTQNYFNTGTIIVKLLLLYDTCVSLGNSELFLLQVGIDLFTFILCLIKINNCSRTHSPKMQQREQLMLSFTFNDTSTCKHKQHQVTVDWKW